MPELTDLPGVESATTDEYLLEAIYFDTADLRLLVAGITLPHRTAPHRTGGADAGWHLKLPPDAPEKRSPSRPSQTRYLKP